MSSNERDLSLGISHDASFETPIKVSDDLSYINTHARIAVYDDLLSAPRIIDIEPTSTINFIENIASNTYDYSHKLGGNLPYSAIREIAENFIHARFRECTVSILDKGNTIRFSDQGPGIEKKSLVQQPGITSATSEMKRYIRGVGSGFPIVKEYLQHSNGYLSIDDNAMDGTVVTLSINPVPPEKEHYSAPVVDVPMVSKRDKELLLLLFEEGVLGPSDLVVPMNVSVSTAFRLLEKLEKQGLVEVTANRKRILSNVGLDYVQTLL